MPNYTQCGHNDKTSTFEELGGLEHANQSHAPFPCHSRHSGLQTLTMVHGFSMIHWADLLRPGVYSLVADRCKKFGLLQKWKWFTIYSRNQTEWNRERYTWICPIETLVFMAKHFFPPFGVNSFRCWNFRSRPNIPQRPPTNEYTHCVTTITALSSL